jgi:hypothetical protein
MAAMARHHHVSQEAPSKEHHCQDVTWGIAGSCISWPQSCGHAIYQSPSLWLIIVFGADRSTFLQILMLALQRYAL